MRDKLDNIINTINSHPEWDKDVKIRYAYLELGKIVQKDTMFFYTIQDNLQSQGKEKLRYSIDHVRDIMETGIENCDYKVICRSAALMLQEILNSCGIECEIRKTLDSSIYKENEEEVEVRHYFIIATGEENRKYFLTLNPDLANIQIGRKTSHFANSIRYIEERETKQADGTTIKEEIQVYEGDEIKHTVLTQEEINRLDEIIGYKSNHIFKEKDGKLKEQKVYTDYFFNLLKEAHTNNYEYYYSVVADTKFYYDLKCLLNGEKKLNQITKEESNYEDSYIEFEINKKTLEEWEDVKKYLLDNVIPKLYSDFNISNMCNLDKFRKLVEKKNYKDILKTFCEDVFKYTEYKNYGELSQFEFFSPMYRLNALSQLLNIIDKFEIKEYNPSENEEEAKAIKKEFINSIRNVSILFVDKTLLPIKKDNIPSTCIENKIIKSFKDIFDINYVSGEKEPNKIHKTVFNDMGLSEQVTIIKEILEIILPEVKPEKNVFGYDSNKTAVQNKILSTVLFNKENNNPYYLMVIKNSGENNGTFSTILFDLKENKLQKGVSVIDVFKNNYIIKDNDLKLAIEQIEEENVTEINQVAHKSY